MSHAFDGMEVLSRTWSHGDKIEKATIAAMRKGELGSRATGTIECIGRSLLLLTEISSCQWGCRRGDHIVENIVRRMCNHTLACLRLSALGLYDEALGPVRSIMEIGNLLQLFSIRPVTRENWKQLDQAARQRKFSPVKIRLSLEEAGVVPIASKDCYGKLCEFGVHITPDSASLSHDIDYSVYVGGCFLAPGLLLVLNQLAMGIAPALSIAGVLVSARRDKMRILEEAALKLADSASWLNVNNYQQYFERFRRDMIERELSRTSQKEWDALVKNVLSELADHGQISRDAVNLSKDEIESLVFPRICQKLLSTAKVVGRETDGDQGSLH